LLVAFRLCWKPCRSHGPRFVPTAARLYKDLSQSTAFSTVGVRLRGLLAGRRRPRNFLSFPGSEEFTASEDRTYVPFRSSCNIGPKASPRRKPPFAASGRAGCGSTVPWCGVWSAICPSCYRSSTLPRHLWKKVRTTNVIERCFVEVRRRTRPMVCFVNVAGVDRIIYSIFQRFNVEWKKRTLKLFTQAA
jgi:hypothetical protein